MREFTKISPTLWASKRFTSLGSDDPKFLFLYFLTSEHQNSAGIFRLRDEYAIADLEWEMTRYQTAREDLVAAKLIRFDVETSTILILDWFRHNAPMNDSHYKGVVRAIQRIDCVAFRLEALEALQEAYEAKKDGRPPRAPQKSESPSGDVLAASASDVSPALKAHLARQRLDA